MLIGGIILGVVVIILIVMFNSLVVKRNAVDNAFAAIDAQLKKRCDLIPNLVASAKAYMKHESETLTNITALRAQAMKPDLTPEEKIQLDNKITELYGKPLYIDDTPSLSVFELRTKARRLVREHGVRIIMIDYLQLMNASGMNFNSRQEEVSTISRSLKGLAKELNIPIIALSQLNRGVEAREGNEGKRPQLSDLRESGAIEQDADMVCFIHRPDYYKIYEDPVTKKDLRGVAQVIIAKHRNGATGDVNLRFKSEYARFMNEEDLIQPGETLESRINDPMQVPPSNDYTLPPPDDSLPY